MSTKRTISINKDTTKLIISFVDEKVDLTGETIVDGDVNIALAYAPIFENDLRVNNAKLFPQPEMPGMPMEERVE